MRRRGLGRPRAWRSGLLVVLLLLGGAAEGEPTDEEGDRIEFRIVEGLPKPKHVGTTSHSSEPTKPTPSREPKTLDPDTPPSLMLLYGSCFSSQIGNYKYEICPFSNVTQLDTTASWNPFYGILGVWDRWEEGSEFKVGLFTDGTKCGHTPRTVAVTFICAPNSTDASIAEVNEPETCKYTAELHAPQLCESAERALEILSERQAAQTIPGAGDATSHAEGEEAPEASQDGAGASVASPGQDNDVAGDATPGGEDERTASGLGENKVMGK